MIRIMRNWRREHKLYFSVIVAGLALVTLSAGGGVAIVALAYAR